MRNILFLLSFIFLYSCSIEKRLYQKGYHIVWKRKIKPTSKNNIEMMASKEFFMPSVDSLVNKEKSSTLISFVGKKHFKNKYFSQPHTLPLATQDKKIKYILFASPVIAKDSVFKQEPDSNEKNIKKLTTKSFALGLISLISTILTPFLILVPVAIICGILAIIRGRQATKLMDKDVYLNNKYRIKARKGMRLGMTFVVLLIT